MVDQKTGGQPRRIGEGHGQRHGSQHQRRIEADPGHIQTAARPHSPRVKQQQQQNAGHKAVCVVPALVGDAPQRRDAPELGNGGTVSHVKGQSCEKAVLKGQVPRLVPGVKQRPRQVHQSAEHPAQEAVLPRPGAGCGSPRPVHCTSGRLPPENGGGCCPHRHRKARPISDRSGWFAKVS